MMKNKILKLVAMVSIVTLLSLVAISNNAYAILPQNSTSWYWTSDTKTSSVIASDVDGDGGIEIVSGGYYTDNTVWSSQLTVWNGTTLALENVRVWYWTSNTQIASVAAGDVDGDGGIEIVTAGAYFDNTRWNAQLIIWNGSTLAFENARLWYWTSNTQISSIAVANISGGIGLDIVTGGSYFDGTQNVAQLVVWNGTNLSLENVRVWSWTSNTYISSVIASNVDADPAVEIVTGGAYFDNTRWNAQIVVWNGANLALKNVRTWFWTGDTDIASIAAGDVDGDGGLEILTAGSYFDTLRNNAQLVVWNGSTVGLENVKVWYFTSNTVLSSVAYGDVNADGIVDVVTGGKFFDGTRYNAQVTVQPGTTLVGNAGANWFTISDTLIESLAISNLIGTGNRIVTGGAYSDLTRSIAQVEVWG